MTQVLDWNSAVRFLSAQIVASKHVVAVSGGTCSGKTTFANQMVQVAKKNRVAHAIVSLDDYYRDKDDTEFPKDSEGQLLFDVPNAYLADEFALATLRLCEDCRMRLVIAEGLFAVMILRTRAVSALNIFVDMPIETCLQRRIERDTKLYRVSVGQIEQTFNRKVRPYWEQFILPQRAYADLIIREGR